MINFKKWTVCSALKAQGTVKAWGTWSQLLIVGCLPFFLIACVNRVDGEELEVNQGKNLPLKFVADIKEVVNTRVANNAFEEGDEVGLFALTNQSTLQEERYADNLHFIRSSSGEFTSEATVYYPEEGVNLCLISYYPYQSGGIALGKSTLPVSVSVDQSQPTAYAKSDFLIAMKENVMPSKEAVPLTYQHQFFHLKIALVAGEGEDIQQLLAANPQLTFHGFYTQAVYDFQDKSFSSFSNEKVMVPAGEWKVEGNRLVGKEIILIPQETTDGYQYLVFKVKGKTYTSFLPSTLRLNTGKQRELDITFQSQEDILMSQVNAEIGDWEGTDVDQTHSVTLHNYVDVTSLTFDKSNIYKVLHEGKQVAEICKEYLVTSTLSAQAIVAYPMNKKGNVDLLNGVVVQIIGHAEPIHGGSVSWNVDDNSLTYVAGNKLFRKWLYVKEDGTLSLSVRSAENVLSVLPVHDVVRDVRGGTIRNYPLVKIGTQYWMRSNWEAELLSDGTALNKIDSVSAALPGYVMTDGMHHFYTVQAALNKQLLLDHWSLPTWKDWNRLIAYVGNNASVVKAGLWSPVEGEEQAQPSTNLTGLDIQPFGMWVDGYRNPFVQKYVGFWTLDEAETGMAAEEMILKSDRNTFEKSSAGLDKKAYAIRCIRK